MQWDYCQLFQCTQPTVFSVKHETHCCCCLVNGEFRKGEASALFQTFRNSSFANIQNLLGFIFKIIDKHNVQQKTSFRVWQEGGLKLISYNACAEILHIKFETKNTNNGAETLTQCLSARVKTIK